MVISKGPVWRHLSVRVVLRPGETYSDSVHRRRVNQDRRQDSEHLYSAGRNISTRADEHHGLRAEVPLGTV